MILRDFQATDDARVYVHASGSIGLALHIGALSASVSLTAADARAIGRALLEAADLAGKEDRT